MALTYVNSSVVIDGTTYTNANIGALSPSTGAVNINNVTKTDSSKVELTSPSLYNLTYGDYVVFTVSIHNTGATYLTWNNTTNLAYVNDLALLGDTTSVVSEKYYQVTMSQWMNYSTTTIVGPETASQYYGYLGTSPYNMYWESDWGDFSTQTPLIALGHSVTFQIYTGLGNDAPQTIGGNMFSMSLRIGSVVP